MARLFWSSCLLALVAGLVAGASWAAAYNSLGSLLGAPPPRMGTQSTTFVWHGMPWQPGHQQMWRFAFSPTSIPGAPSVEVYVSPIGRVVETQPGDLAARIKQFHNTGY